MKKRIQLPSEVRREQIVQAALKIFATKGFDATTNKEIAKEAGIASPGLIYHHFLDKASLLRAVIELHMQKDMARPDPEIIMGMGVEEGLRFLLSIFLRDIDRPEFVAFTRVLIGEAMRRPECAQVLSEMLVQRMFDQLTAFFAHHVAAGNLRPIDPTVATLRFVGSTIGLLITRDVLAIPAVCSLDRTALERQLVDDFLRGIQP